MKAVISSSEEVILQQGITVEYQKVAPVFKKLMFCQQRVTVCVLTWLRTLIIFETVTCLQ